MIFDLHVHTTISKCSQLKIEEILTHAQSRGLDGVCITDHEDMGIGRFVREGIQENGLCIIFGMEYSTPHGDFILFGPFENIPFGLCARELLKTVNQSAGVAIAAHPFRKNNTTEEYVFSEGLCSNIERINGRNSVSENGLTKDWIDKYNLIGSGGSDAHTLPELGRVKTHFATPIQNRFDLIKELKTGHCSIETAV